MDEATEELFKIFKGGGILFFGKIGGRGIGFIGQILVATALAPAEFGIIGLTLTVVSVIGSIVLFGVNKAVPRRMSEPDRDQGQVLTAGYVTVGIVGAFGTLLVFLFPGVIADIFGANGVEPVLRAFAIYIVIFPLAMVTIGGLRGLELSKEATFARDLVGHGAGIVVFLGFSWVDKPFLGGILYFISIQVFRGLSGTYFISKLISFSTSIRSFPTGEIKDLLSFSWPLAVSANLILVMNNFDVLMIGYFLESQSVGYYRVIQPLGRLVMIPLVSLVFLLLPVATRYFEADNNDVVADIYSVATKWITYLIFPAVVVLITFPETIIQTFYGTDYLPGATALSVYAIGMFLRVAAGPNGAIIKAIDRTRIELIASLVGVVTNVVLNILLIPRFGIVGAAMATGSGFLMYNLVEITIVYRTVGMHPFSLNTTKPLIVTAVATVVAKQYVLPDRLNILSLILFGLGIGMFEMTAVWATRSLSHRDNVLLAHLLDEIGVEGD